MILSAYNLGEIRLREEQGGEGGREKTTKHLLGKRIGPKFKKEINFKNIILFLKLNSENYES